jgi:leader peptidase (prepilin peptidase)/N-methyltransferase
MSFGLTWNTLKYAIFVTFLVVASFIDIEHRIIPNVLNLAFFIIAVSFIVIFKRNIWFEYLVSSSIVGGLLMILAIVFPKGMGIGDAKFMAVCGLFLGYQSIVALFLGFLIGAIYGLFLMAIRKKKMKEKISFGPFLALGCAIAIFFGDRLIRLYLSAFL